MRVIWTVATDLLREAMARRWFIGLFGVLTLGLVGVALALRLDVVDGALAVFVELRVRFSPYHRPFALFTFI